MTHNLKNIMWPTEAFSGRVNNSNELSPRTKSLHQFWDINFSSSADKFSVCDTWTKTQRCKLGQSKNDLHSAPWNQPKPKWKSKLVTPIAVYPDFHSPMMSTYRTRSKWYTWQCMHMYKLKAWNKQWFLVFLKIFMVRHTYRSVLHYEWHPVQPPSPSQCQLLSSLSANTWAQPTQAHIKSMHTQLEKAHWDSKDCLESRESFAISYVLPFTPEVRSHLKLYDDALGAMETVKKAMFADLFWFEGSTSSLHQS